MPSLGGMKCSRFSYIDTGTVPHAEDVSRSENPVDFMHPAIGLSSLNAYYLDSNPIRWPVVSRICRFKSYAEIITKTTKCGTNPDLG